MFGDCDNDVVDNQVAIMEFESGATATLSVIACAEDVCIRKTRVMGSGGELVGDGDRTITHFNFVTGAYYSYHLILPGGQTDKTPGGCTPRHCERQS